MRIIALCSVLCVASSAAAFPFDPPLFTLISNVNNARQLAILLDRVKDITGDKPIQKIRENLCLPSARSYVATVYFGAKYIEEGFHREESFYEYEVISLERPAKNHESRGPEKEYNYTVRGEATKSCYKYYWLRDEKAEVTVDREIEYDTLDTVITAIRDAGHLEWKKYGDEKTRVPRTVPSGELLRNGFGVGKKDDTITIHWSLVTFKVEIKDGKATIGIGRQGVV